MAEPDQETIARLEASEARNAELEARIIELEAAAEEAAAIEQPEEAALDSPSGRQPRHVGVRLEPSPERNGGFQVRIYPQGGLLSAHNEHLRATGGEVDEEELAVVAASTELDEQIEANERLAALVAEKREALDAERSKEESLHEELALVMHQLRDAAAREAEQEATALKLEAAKTQLAELEDQVETDAALVSHPLNNANAAALAAKVCNCLFLPLSHTPPPPSTSHSPPPFPLYSTIHRYGASLCTGRSGPTTTYRWHCTPGQSWRVYVPGSDLPETESAVRMSLGPDAPMTPTTPQRTGSRSSMFGQMAQSPGGVDPGAPMGLCRLLRSL